MTPVAVVWVLTWLWQGCLLTAAAAVVLRVSTPTNAATRFLVWWGTLAAVLILAGIHIIPGRWAVTVSTPTTWSHEVGVAQQPAARESDTRTGTTLTFPLAVPPTPAWLGLTLAVVWIGFSVLRLSRLLLSLWQLRALKRATVPIPAGIERDLPYWLAMRHRGRRTQLRVSSGVASAAMLGVGSPVIALPRQLIDTLVRADLDRVVMHEYGHAQRYDDWAILAEAAIDVVFGWHPAVWWIGRQLAVEREVASDDWVARHTSTAHDYACCLTRVAELALRRRPIPHSVTAVRSRRELAWRIERLLEPRPDLTVHPAGMALTIGALSVSGVVLLLALSPPLVSARAEDLTRLIPAPRPASFRPPLVLVGQRRASPLTRVVSGAQAMTPISPSEEASVTALPATGLALPSTVPLPATRTRFKAPLPSRTLRLDDTMRVPSYRRTDMLDLRARSAVRDDRNRSPWVRLATLGKAVGIGATDVGQVTASAFQDVGAGFTRVFGGR